MPKEKIIWKHKKAAELYHKTISVEASGVVDEKYVKDYIASRGIVKVVSLGIGTGRELSWLDRLTNIKEVIGIDYSKVMLDICKEEAKKYKLKVTLIKDDLLSFKKFKGNVRQEKSPLIYICLINTLGNFEEKDRGKVLKNLKKNLMKKKDRLVLCLYKRPEKIKTKMFLPPQIKIRGDSGERVKLGEVIEYSSYELIWPPVLEKYLQFPRFWYDERSNDIVVYAGKKKIFLSHRFSKEEIKKLCQIAKLKIEKLIEGKFMWVVILKT